MTTVLDYKLDLLKIEIDTINKAILDKDETSRQVKGWTITLWVAAVGFAGTKHIQNPSFASTIWAISTAFIPVSFFILDALNKRIQRKFIWRAKKIHRFVNDIEWSLKTSIEEGDITSFRIYDPGGENWRMEEGYEESKKFQDYISLCRLALNPSLFVLYATLIVFSFGLAAVAWLPVLAVFK